MAKTLKIGSVGLGRLGYEHAKNIANYVTGAELTAICDTDAARVAQVAEELNVPYTYTDVAEMVKNPELDAIVIVSPSTTFVCTGPYSVITCAGAFRFVNSRMAASTGNRQRFMFSISK